MSEVEKYRCLVTAPDLVSARVRIRESDLLVRAGRDLGLPARAALARYRGEIEDYLFRHPEWGRSLSPLAAARDASPIVGMMSRAAAACGVGPMATVAGALAWFVGREISALAGEVIVENGGDIYLSCRRKRTILVWTGEGSAFRRKIGIRLAASPHPVGAASSSGMGGRSLSWGKAAAAVVVARDSILADGGATALGNRVRSSQRPVIEAALESIAAIPGVSGCLVICRNLLAVRGEIELVDLGERPSGREGRPPGAAGRRG